MPAEQKFPQRASVKMPAKKQWQHVQKGGLFQHRVKEKLLRE